MIIARFGSTWAAGYDFGQIKGASEFPITRPASISQVGGVAGAFDHFGDDNYPLAPQIVTHSFNLSAATWAAIEPALDNLKKYTIGMGRTKLWSVCRDYSHRWAWAKCVGLEVSEVNRSYLRTPVKLSFQLTEGLWYNDEMHDLSYLYTGDFYCPNYGVYRSSLKMTVRPLSAPLTSFTLLNDDNSYTWTYTGTVPDGQYLVVDSGAYICTVNGVGTYSGLSLGAGQTMWMKLEPGVPATTNSMHASWTPGGATVWLGTQWWDTYL